MKIDLTKREKQIILAGVYYTNYQFTKSMKSVRLLRNEESPRGLSRDMNASQLWLYIRLLSTYKNTSIFSGYLDEVAAVIKKLTTYVYLFEDVDGQILS